MIRSFQALAVVGTLAASMAFPQPCAAATFNVNSLNDSGPGSLRQAISAANTNPGSDTIAFSVSGTITLTSGELVLTESVQINGPGARSVTVSGGNSSRIFRLDGVTPKEVAITDLTLANGNTFGNGGALLNEGGNLLLQRMRIVNNTAGDSGGAIYNAFFDQGNLLTVRDSEISGNQADSEGAIYFIGFQLSLLNSTVSGNSATDSVGAIGIQFGDARIRNSTVFGNAANLVGGIQSQSSVLAIESSIIAFNTDGTGINDVNRIADGTASASSSLFTEDVNATSVFNGTNSGNQIGVDPQLNALANNGGPTNSHRPRAGSPAIANGSNSTGLVNDQRGDGFVRNAGGAVDVGAIQRVLSVPEVAVPTVPPALLLLLTALLGAAGLRQLRQ